MNRPRCLDLFCGAGGAAMGLHRAGFDVVGIDIKRQKRYPFPFIQGDALNPPVRLEDFDLIWASPPCQAHTSLRKMWNSRKHEDLVPQTRALLASHPFTAIENVVVAPLLNPVRLCGTSFGLGVRDAELRRHRLFECSFFVMAPECLHGQRVAGVYGGHVRDRCRTLGVYGEAARLSVDDSRGTISINGHSPFNVDRRKTISVTGSTPQQNVVRNRVRETYSADDAREAMGIDWTTLAELCQAVPPAYSEHIGRYAMMALGRE